MRRSNRLAILRPDGYSSLPGGENLMDRGRMIEIIQRLSAEFPAVEPANIELQVKLWNRCLHDHLSIPAAVERVVEQHVRRNLMADQADLRRRAGLGNTLSPGSSAPALTLTKRAAARRPSPHDPAAASAAAAKAPTGAVGT
jgi:hypothetical protein